MADYGMLIGDTMNGIGAWAIQPESGASFTSVAFADRPASAAERIRLARVGDTITSSYWTGADWVVAGTTTVSFDTTQVGLYALAAQDGTLLPAAFDSFTIEHAPGADVAPQGAFADGEELAAVARVLATLRRLHGYLQARATKYPAARRRVGRRGEPAAARQPCARRRGPRRPSAGFMASRRRLDHG